MRRLPGRLAPAGLLGVLLLTGPPAYPLGALQPIRIDASLAQRERSFQLEIVVNGEASGFVAPFVFDPKTNTLFAERGDLEKAGILVPGRDKRVRVDTLGLPFNFDEARQRIELTLNQSQRRARAYSASPEPDRIVPEISPGVLVNYSVFAGSFKDIKTPGIRFTGANLSIDARAFSRFGVLRQTGIAGTTLHNEGNSFLRLETTYSYSHPGTAITRAGGRPDFQRVEMDAADPHGRCPDPARLHPSQRSGDAADTGDCGVGRRSLDGRCLHQRSAKLFAERWIGSVRDQRAAVPVGQRQRTGRGPRRNRT